VPLALLIFLGGAGMAAWRPAAAAGVAVVHVTLFLGGWILLPQAAAAPELNPVLLTAAALLMLGALAALLMLSYEKPAVPSSSRRRVSACARALESRRSRSPGRGCSPD
jgi:hypothetical protein